MLNRLITPLLVVLATSFFCLPVSAEASEWQQLLKTAKTAIEKNDTSYAFYKLRKAWLAVPEKGLEAEPYKEIATALADAFDQEGEPGPAREAKRIRDGSYSLEKIDRRFRQREFNSSGDDYSVELRNNGALAFEAKGLDSMDGEGVCAHIKVSPENAEEMRKAAIRARLEWKKKMPLMFTPDSTKYQELLSLCQPIKPGEKKEHTGFDLSPFVPKNLPRTPDI